MQHFLWAREDGTPGILNTPHDLQVITGESGLDPCVICHSVHTMTGQVPTWNRDQGPQTYTMYNSPSFDMNEFNSGPQDPSSMCLVCHNGIFSSLVGYPGPGSHPNETYDYEMNPTFWAMLDTDLREMRHRRAPGLVEPGDAVARQAAGQRVELAAIVFRGNEAHALAASFSTQP